MALTTSLISFWEFDEASGTRLDSTTSDNDIGDSDASGRLTGVNGGWSARLINASLSCTTNASLETGNIDWTITGWVALNAWSDYYTIVAKYPPTENQREYALYYYHDIDKLELVVRKGDDSGYIVVDSTVTIASSDNSWHFYVIGFNSAIQKSFISVDNETLVLSAATTTMHVGNGAFQFGGNVAGAGTEFDGYVDQAGFWKRVLTTTERTWLYNSGTGRSYAQIVAESATTEVLGAQILM